MKAAFDFPRHPLHREDGERLRGQWADEADEWLIAERPEQVAPLLDAAHAAARAGAWVLGGLRYEAAAALDAHLPALSSEAPLAAFAVYRREPEPWAPQPGDATRCTPWADALREEVAHAAAIEAVRDFIRAGDVYQVNLTTRLQSRLLAPLAELFGALHAAQPGGFSLFIERLGVASVSPELFFDWRPLPDHPKTWLLATQPMKGTAPRGADRAADEAAQAYLRTSEKERAENLMIVDLLRNDLGRVAVTGSVRVPRLFELHALPTVWQMTSTVSAVTRASLKLSALFAALFPCGSVTGAPKRRAMQLISELEAQARGWYCGALGLIQPGGAATFNVPIRTVETAPGGSLRAGVGSAITLDAEPAPELAEWQAKRRFLVRAQAPVAALETMRLQDGHFPDEAAHRARLRSCARHFGLGLPQIDEALAQAASAHPQGVWRVRLSWDGRQAQLQTQALAHPPATVTLALSAQAFPTRDAWAEFIQHKTTRRERYEAALAAKPADAWDVILHNEDGELTEGCFGNIALCLDGRWLTPRRAAGLLPGIGRAHWLAAGRVAEARLLREDLARASALAWFNALRGWLPARLR